MRRARRAERIAFRQINKATGNRLRQQLIDEETREPVAPEHKGRGYEIGKGHYLVIEDAELDAIKIESTHTIEIDRLVPRSPDRPTLFRHSLLCHAQRTGWARRLCGHPGSHASQGDGGTRAAGALETRARHRA